MEGFLQETPGESLNKTSKRLPEGNSEGFLQWTSTGISEEI